MNVSDIDKLTRALNYFNNGKLDKAEQLCLKVIKRHQSQPDTLNILGAIALRKKQYQRAISLLEKAIYIHPNEYLFHYNIGLAYSKSSRYEEAIKSFQKVIQLNPSFEVVYSDLCHTLTLTGDFDLALDAGKTAIKYDSNNANAYNNLAVTYEAMGFFESATKHYLRAVELSQNNPVFLKNLANIYLGIGNKESAEKYYRKAIKSYPTFGEPYLQLCHMRKYTSSDDADAKIIREILDNKSINNIDRCDLYFALGKILDDCRNYDEAFMLFYQANSLANKRYVFKPDSFKQYITNLIQWFSNDFMQQHEHIADSVSKPIFIVGMPRSGTSLIEQILASHHLVYGAGELLYFGQLEKRLSSLLNSSEAYPDCLSLLNHSDAQLITKKYLQYIKSISNAEDRVTDKMPENFLRIGLIKLLFGRAKFIYCRRNPMDVGLSIYQQRFAGSIHWGYDLYNIGAYYAQHVRIMDHWLNLFPSSILTVEYEDLVQNQEDVSRRIVEFIGLTWDENCLYFSKTERHVHTASDTQVKKPIYTSSVARYRHYEKHLAPLSKGLSEYSN